MPFLDDGRIKEGERRRIIKWFVEQDVSGHTSNDGTGDLIRLGFEEHNRTSAIVAAAARGRVPVLAGSRNSRGECREPGRGSAREADCAHMIARLYDDAGSVLAEPSPAIMRWQKSFPPYRVMVHCAW